MAKPAAPERPPYGGGRDALLNAAIEVVSSSGLRGLTIRAVAEQAGVSHGLVRWHFGSREGLVEATLIRSVEQSIASSSLEPQSGRIEEMAAGLPTWAEDRVEVAAFQYECLLEARRNAKLYPHVSQMYASYMESIGRTLERANLGEDADLARVVFATLDGLVLQQTAFGGPERTERAVAILQEMVEALRASRDAAAS